jgi:hypothetical protein
LSNPKYVKINDELYEINTDFRIALECNDIAQDDSITDYERALAIIYKLFGEKGLMSKDMNKLLELGIQYLSLGRTQKELKNDSQKNYELDFKKCEGLIRSSFKFDYKYDPYQLEYLHYYDFNNDLENLSTSEFGNCCILNRVAMILEQDCSKIKDSKERSKLKRAQEQLKEKYCAIKEKEQTEGQKESAEAFYEALGIKL